MTATRCRSPLASVSDLVRLLGGVLACVLVAAPSELHGQVDSTGHQVSRTGLEATGIRSSPWRLPGPYRPQLPSQPAPGVAFLSSAILPGAGQYLLKEERWVPYIAVEVWAILTYLQRRNGGRALARQYRDLASVARRVSTVLPLRDTTFEYYEAMAKHDDSGLFDTDLRPDVFQPELDETTFNGEVWRLARSLYWPGGLIFPPESPQYLKALEYYKQHAIPPAFHWTWGGSRLEQQAFIDLISDSDEAFRTATHMLGVLVANHIVSAVDALVTARIRYARPSGVRVGVRSGPASDVAGARWACWVQLAW